MRRSMLISCHARTLWFERPCCSLIILWERGMRGHVFMFDLVVWVPVSCFLSIDIMYVYEVHGSFHLSSSLRSLVFLVFLKEAKCSLYSQAKRRDSQKKALCWRLPFTFPRHREVLWCCTISGKRRERYDSNSNKRRRAAHISWRPR